jgi:hypothetical protein
MSATAASTPIAERSTEPIFDREWLNAALIRWKAAEEYVSFLDVELLPTEHVLRRLMAQDLETLLRELTRLRPDLV